MVDILLRAIADWASMEPSIRAVGLVGSQARGTARGDSDVDLIVIGNPAPFFENLVWINRFGEVRGVRDENWGQCRSMRVFYLSGLEVEFGFVFADWARIDPVDPGTREVVAGGLRVLYDPENMLQRLAAAVPST